MHSNEDFNVAVKKDRQFNSNSKVAVKSENLHKAFGKLKVLQGISTEIHQGEVVAIIGPSGSGKSTFLRCMNLLEVPTSGKIYINGVDITARKTDIMKIRQNVGMVFQHFHLFPHMTVLKNVMYAPLNVKHVAQDEARREGMELLTKVGLAEKADVYPEMVKEVLEVMKDLTKPGITMAIVTHEMGFAREVADRILFLDQGRLAEDTPPSQFFTNPQCDRAKQFLEKML